MRIGGNTLTCDVAHLPQPGSDQALEALVVILQSISTEAEAQKARLETIAAMVEELQTPLSTVVGYADLLLSEAMGGVEGVKRKFLQRMKADAERMSLVVNDLALEVGRTEPECHPQPQEVQVNDAIESALSTARPQLGIKVLSTDIQLASDLPPIEADPEHVQRSLGGLLSNACMASPVGGRIQVRSYRSGGPPNERSQQQLGLGYVTVSIRDQGGGLTDSALDRVFERTRPAQTPPGLGESGAELAIVKALVEANEGHIWIDSRGGIGTTFSFALPVSQPGAESSPRRAAKDPGGWTAPEDFVAG
jgi:signal transduction histidine kinase